ncbi:cytochrome c family protein [Rhodococcus sp. SRB_17]|nr:cytochrome c family protein [Rhodococcus sp. SRB_17]
MSSVQGWLRWGVAVLACGVTALAAAAPDALRGEQVYARCLACHALAYDRVGPHHCGLLGRRAGSVPGFAYSDAMKKSGLVWDEKTLDLFLRKPLALVPGSSMAYDGVPDASERSDLIAYLRQAGQSPQCRPQAKDGAGPKGP